MAASAYGFLRARGRRRWRCACSPQAERDGWNKPLSSSVLDDRHSSSTRSATPSRRAAARSACCCIRFSASNAAPTAARCGSAGPTRPRRTNRSSTLRSPTCRPTRRCSKGSPTDYANCCASPATIPPCASASPPAPRGCAPIGAPAVGRRPQRGRRVLRLAGQQGFCTSDIANTTLAAACRTGKREVRPNWSRILGDEGRSRFQSARPLRPTAARLERPPLLLVSRRIHPVRFIAPHRWTTSPSRRSTRGAVIGIRHLVGLFTAKAYADAASELPLLRRCLAAILAREASWRILRRTRSGAFNSFPRRRCW